MLGKQRNCVRLDLADWWMHSVRSDFLKERRIVGRNCTMGLRLWDILELLSLLFIVTALCINMEMN